jgi:hypothetical protein
MSTKEVDVVEKLAAVKAFFTCTTPEDDVLSEELNKNVDADKHTSSPLAPVRSVKADGDVIVTPAPAVTVQVPAPLLASWMTSPTVKMLLFTVIVVALAEFMIVRFDSSPAIKTYEAVLSEIGKFWMSFKFWAVRVAPETNGNGVVIVSPL